MLQFVKNGNFKNTFACLLMNAIRKFFLQPWLYLAIIFIGAALKFYQLNNRMFWEDEVSTILYTSGKDPKFITKDIPVNQIKTAGYYDSLIQLGKKPYTITSEVKEIFSETHLTPAHYVFLTIWYRMVGDKEIDYRLFSVFIFLLSMPLVFLLAKNLFHSLLAGWMAASLFAVSPFINGEAQDARYYMLWIFFFILINYLFLKFVKQGKWIYAAAYVIAAILALYTSLLSGVCVLCHLLYVWAFAKDLRVRFTVCFLLIGLAYLPWLYFLFSVRGTIESGLSWHKIAAHSSVAAVDLLLLQLQGFVLSFSYPFGFETDNFAALLKGGADASVYFLLVINLAILLLIVYSVFYLFAKTPRPTKWFIALNVFPLFLLFYFTDLVRHAYSSAIWRYQVTDMAGILLVVTNLLKDKIVQRKLFYSGVYLALVLIGIASIVKIEENRCWNERPDCDANLQEAELIAHAKHPLIITDFSDWGFVNFLAILKQSGSVTAGVMYSNGSLPDITGQLKNNTYSEIYVDHASDKLVQNLKAQFGENMVPLRPGANMMSPQIWQIKVKE